ncbi:MAG: heat shock protein HspQ [Gammaproteobacteria bacterium]
MKTSHTLKFHVGQIIEHKMFGYRGVIYDVDAEFSGTDIWYEQVAKSCPPKNAPWYYVLVDDSDTTTYVAEQNVSIAHNTAEINHPLVNEYFLSFSNNRYNLALKQ